MCIACISGLLSAGASLTAARGAAGLAERRRRRLRRPAAVALVLASIVGAAMLPVSVGGAPERAADPPPSAVR